jgi:hypothetical protein
VAAHAVLTAARSLVAIAEWAADAPQPVRAALGARREAPNRVHAQATPPGWPTIGAATGESRPSTTIQRLRGVTTGAARLHSADRRAKTGRPDWTEEEALDG